MKSESKVIAELWDLMRDYVPAGRRSDIAISILQIFDEYGFESRDMADIMDEDVHLRRAYLDLFEFEDDEDEEEEE